MSEIASLGLCKELYELSGWKDKYFYTPMGDGHRLLGHRLDGSIAAYSLGYLLRRLPAQVEGWDLSISNYSGVWVAYYEDASSMARHPNEANTPEDAACKLAIQLFKQGVLERESQS